MSRFFGSRSLQRFFGLVCSLVAIAALVSPAVAGACTAVAVRFGDHPGYVRAVVDFTGGTIGFNQVSATDPSPMNGTAALLVERPGVRTRVPGGSGDGITVRLVQGSGRLRIAITARAGRFKYLSYAVVTGDRIAIDLWNSTPPSRAAEIRRGVGGCLTLDSWKVNLGTVSVTGRERGVFENQFQVNLRGSDGRVLAQRHVDATNGHWSAQLNYHASRRQPGTLEAAALSPKDGALSCLAQVRVTLPATGAGAAAVYVTNIMDASVSQYAVGLDGTLRAKSPATVPADSAPLGIAISPNRRSVYAVGFSGVSQYDVESSGALKPKSPAIVAAAGGDGWVVVSPNGKNVYVTNINGNSVSEYSVGAGGKLTPKSPATVPVSFPRGLAISPDGTSVYVTFSGTQSGIAQFTVGPNGELLPKSPAQVLAPGPLGWLAVSPDSKSLYATSEMTGRIVQYTVGAGGRLTLSPITVRTGAEPEGIVVSPDGKSVYVANFKVQGGDIAQFDVGAGGRLTAKTPATVPTAAGPEGLAISPSGKFLYAANTNRERVSQYDVGPSGKLKPASPPTVPTGPNPYAIAVLPGTTR